MSACGGGFRPSSTPLPLRASQNWSYSGTWRILSEMLMRLRVSSVAAYTLRRSSGGSFFRPRGRLVGSMPIIASGSCESRIHSTWPGSAIVGPTGSVPPACSVIASTTVMKVLRVSGS